MDIQAWDDVHGAKSQETLQAFFDSRTDSYAILQLKRTDETAQDRFMNYSWLESHDREPEVDHYDVVYTGSLPSGTGLEDLYVKFNIDHPADYTGHSLSVSDIVALKQAGVVSCYYVDSIGFRHLPDFHPENYLRNAEMATEDDYDMVGDGLINNGPKEPVRDERPSVLEKLKNASETEFGNGVAAEADETPGRKRSRMNFTKEELTLMMLYSPGTRRGLITTLEGMREELTKSERRLRSLTDSVLEKLALITNEEFDQLPLYPDLDL